MKHHTVGSAQRDEPMRAVAPKRHVLSWLEKVRLQTDPTIDEFDIKQVAQTTRLEHAIPQRHELILPSGPTFKTQNVGDKSRREVARSEGGGSRFLHYEKAHPFELCEIMSSKEEPGQAIGSCALAGSNVYWARFSPYDTDETKIEEYFLANSFFKRYQALSADRQALLEGLWYNEVPKEQIWKTVHYSDASVIFNFDFVLAIVSRDGMLLERMGVEFKDNEQIVLAAVQQNPHALRHAAPRLRRKERVVLAAVALDGTVLQYADPVLQERGCVVRVALNNNARATEIARIARQRPARQSIANAFTYKKIRPMAWPCELNVEQLRCPIVEKDVSFLKEPVFCPSQGSWQVFEAQAFLIDWVIHGTDKYQREVRISALRRPPTPSAD